jgi:hypothetical protein
MLIIIDLYSCAYDGNNGCVYQFKCMTLRIQCAAAVELIRYETLLVNGCPLLLGRVCAKSMLISRGSGASRKHPNYPDSRLSPALGWVNFVLKRAWSVWWTLRGGYEID